MAIRIFAGYPPDRESPQAELLISYDGGVDIPAILIRSEGELMIELFSRAGGEPEWTLPLSELVAAVEEGRNCLGE